MTRVGLISDTHGRLRPEAVAFLRGSDFIVHAGYIGDAKVLRELNALAPVTAVRGNNDKGPWAKAIPYRKFSKRAMFHIAAADRPMVMLTVFPAANWFESQSTEEL